MPGMGPPPNPNARRRNARPARTQLPAEGRKGKAPAWPLLPNLTLLAKLEVAQDVVDDLGDRETVNSSEARKLARAAEQVKILTVQTREIESVESAMWTELWALPQAVAWERLKFFRDVAQYVRWKVLAEWGDMDAAKEARQLSDRLGLTPMSLLRLQWEISVDETAEQRATRTPSTKTAPARRRLKVVDQTG